jgi:prepilin-type processing-associated H-X9-DG protein
MGSLQRASQIILMADGAQQAHGGANSEFYSVPEANSGTTNSSAGDTPIGVTNDVDPATGGYLRYRHGGDSLNVVFVDGHVGMFKKGEILARNMNIYY